MMNKIIRYVILTGSPAQYGVRIMLIFAFDASTNEHVVTTIPTIISIMPNTKAPVACPLDICLAGILLSFIQFICRLRNLFFCLFSKFILFFESFLTNCKFTSLTIQLAVQGFNENNFYFSP